MVCEMQQFGSTAPEEGKGLWEGNEDGRFISGLVTPALKTIRRTLDAVLNMRRKACGPDLMCVSSVSG